MATPPTQPPGGSGQPSATPGQPADPAQQQQQQTNTGNAPVDPNDALRQDLERASPHARKWTLIGLIVLGVIAIVGFGALKWSHNDPFKVNTADFAFFAAFYVLAQAIERFIEPFSAAFGPGGRSKRARADRALYSTLAAVALAILLCSAFGAYFMEAIGVKIGTVVNDPQTHSDTLVLKGGDNWLRGLDIFVTALLISGGTKQLHDLIGRIQAAKDNAQNQAAATSPPAPAPQQNV